MKALAATKINKMDPMEYVAYLMRRNAKMDYEATLDYAKEQGMEKGIELLLKQGVLSIELIADAYKVSVDYIFKIKEKLILAEQKSAQTTAKRGRSTAK